MCGGKLLIFYYAVVVVLWNGRRRDVSNIYTLETLFFRFLLIIDKRKIKKYTRVAI